jgi:ketosteroid isomerase-like protein
MVTSAQNTDTENKVKAVITGSFDAIFSDLDATKIKEYYTDDFILLEHGEVWTNQTIIGYTERAKTQTPLQTRHNRFEFISVKIEGDMAWLAYHNYAHWTLDGKETGKMQWLESATAIKTKNGWRLQMLHSTRVNKKHD